MSHTPSCEGQIQDLLACARVGSSGDIQEIQRVLESTANDPNCSNDSGLTMMHCAAANGNTDVMRFLMSEPYGKVLQREAKTLGGNTALHWAALNNQAEAVRLLLDAGWSVCSRNAMNATPLQTIAGKGYEDIEIELLKHDSELENYDKDRETKSVCATEEEESSETSTESSDMDHTELKLSDFA